MAAGGELAVRAQIHTHAKASRAGASSLILAYHLGRILVQNIPDKNPPIPGCRGKILSIFIERNRPYGGILGHVAGDLGVDVPLARVGVDAPNLDLAAKSGARRYLAISGGDEVVAAQWVSTADGLGERERGRGGLVDIDAGGAAGRDDRLLGCGDGENVG